MVAQAEMISSVASEALWGQRDIAKFLGCSTDYLVKLMDKTDIPVSRIDGKRCFALRSSLRAWVLQQAGGVIGEDRN
jgi:hypothetical protein